MTNATLAGTVGRLMTRDPLTVDEFAPIVDAAELMDTFEVSGLPVVDSDGNVVGVVSQTDLVRAASTRRLWPSWPGFSVRHLMTSPAVTVTPDTTLDAAAALMEQARIHRLVVTEPDGRVPIGVLSLSDFVRLIAEREDD